MCNFCLSRVANLLQLLAFRCERQNIFALSSGKGSDYQNYILFCFSQRNQSSMRNILPLPFLFKYIRIELKISNAKQNEKHQGKDHFNDKCFTFSRMRRARNKFLSERFEKPN